MQKVVREDVQKELQDEVLEEGREHLKEDVHCKKRFKSSSRTGYCNLFVKMAKQDILTLKYWDTVKQDLLRGAFK